MRRLCQFDSELFDHFLEQPQFENFHRLQNVSKPCPQQLLFVLAKFLESVVCFLPAAPSTVQSLLSCLQAFGLVSVEFRFLELPWIVFPPFILFMFFLLTVFGRVPQKTILIITPHPRIVKT